MADTINIEIEFLNDTQIEVEMLLTSALPSTHTSCQVLTELIDDPDLNTTNLIDPI